MDPIDQKDLEEVIEKALQNSQKHQGLIFLLHPRFDYHLAMLFILNSLIGIVTLAIGKLFNVTLIEFTLASYFIFILLATLFETIIKILGYIYFKHVILFSLGTINYVIQVLIFLIVEKMVDQFIFVKFAYLFYFTAIFLIVRVLGILLIRKYSFKNDTFKTLK